MHLFDPARPTIGSRPAMLRCKRSVPQISLEPLTGYRVEVSIMVPYDGYLTSTRRSKIIPVEDLLDFVHSWTENPEEAMLEYFGFNEAEGGAVDSLDGLIVEGGYEDGTEMGSQ